MTEDQPRLTDRVDPPGWRGSPPRSVWIFNHYASTPDRPGYTRHYSLGKAAVRRGVDVTIFAAGYTHSTGVEGMGRGRRLMSVEVVDGVRFIWLRTFPYRGNDWRRMANMASYAVLAVAAAMTRPRPDVVIGSTVQPFAALAGWVVSATRRTRYIYEVRDLWPQTLVDLGAMSPRSTIARTLWAIESFLTRQAETVISALPRMTRYLESRGLSSDHVRYLPNGADLAEFDQARERVLAAPPSILRPLLDELARRREIGETVFVYAGQHGRVNRLEIVLEALAIVNQRGGYALSVFFVGDGPQKGRLIEEAGRLGLVNAVFYDSIPKGEVPALLASVDAGIVHTTATPVYRYGVSFNKLFDYMAAAIPVVFATKTAADPIEASGGGLSVRPDDPSALADAITALIEAGPERRCEMGRRGREFAEREHDLKVLGSRFVEILGVAGTPPIEG